jgi:hypothetical protein
MAVNYCFLMRPKLRLGFRATFKSYEGRFIPVKEADSGRREFYYPTIKDKGVYRFKVVTFDILLNESEAAMLSLTAHVGIGDVITTIAQKVGFVVGILHVLV